MAKNKPKKPIHSAHFVVLDWGNNGKNVRHVVPMERTNVMMLETFDAMEETASAFNQQFQSLREILVPEVRATNPTLYDITHPIDDFLDALATELDTTIDGDAAFDEALQGVYQGWAVAEEEAGLILHFKGSPGKKHFRWDDAPPFRVPDWWPAHRLHDYLANNLDVPIGFAQGIALKMDEFATWAAISGNATLIANDNATEDVATLIALGNALWENWQPDNPSWMDFIGPVFKMVSVK